MQAVKSIRYVTWVCKASLYVRPTNLRPSRTKVSDNFKNNFTWLGKTINYFDKNGSDLINMLVKMVNSGKAKSQWIQNATLKIWQLEFLLSKCCKNNLKKTIASSR